MQTANITEMNESIFKALHAMWKARGWRLPIQYLFQNYLFDQINKTDTHKRLDKVNYLEEPNSFNDGRLYMSCPTNEIKKSLLFLRHRIGDKFYNYQFVDLGTGKGKPVLVYVKLFKEDIKYNPLGIEYYKPLVDIANNNLRVLGITDKATFSNSDAREFDEHISTKNIIVFLYNSFEGSVFNSVLNKVLLCDDVYLIYMDPVFDNILIDLHLEKIDEKKGRFPNRCINIYHKSGNIKNC